MKTWAGILNRPFRSGKLRFLEVKGRIDGAETVTVSKNEILAGLNKPDDYFLAISEIVFSGEVASIKNLHYIRNPFRREPDFAATSVNYNWKELAGIKTGTDQSADDEE